MKNTLIKLLALSTLFVTSFVSIVPIASADQHPDLCPLLTRTLKVGSQGQDVRRLQVVLGQEGIAYLGATGYYGNLTAQAVKIFQLRNSINTTGNVGPITLSAMKNLWCSGNPNIPNNYPQTQIPNNNLPVVNIGNGYNNYPYQNGYYGGSPDVQIIPLNSSGNSVTISWTSNNVSSCVLNGQPVSTSGQNVFSIYTQTDFTISCQNYNGQQTVKTITLAPNTDINSIPRLSVYVNPSTAIVNSYATLNWTSQNTSYCTVNGQSVPTSGSQQIYVSSSATSYKVICSGLNGSAVSSTVYAGGTSQTNNSTLSATITANPQNISSGQQVALNWSSTNATSCTISGGNSTFSGTSGVQYVYPNTNTTYIITCTNGGYTVSNNAYVTVGGSNGGQSITANTNTDLQNYRGQNGTIISVYCPAGLSQTPIWGSGIYSDDSSVCTAAVHAGLINFASGGTVNALIGPAQNSFNSTVQNGITSSSYGYWVGSFTFTGTQNNSNISANISANPSYTSYSGQSVTLSWYSQNATYCNIVNQTTGANVGSNQPTSGTYLVTPTSSANYQITCFNSSGQSATANTSVTVAGIPPTSGTVTVNLNANTTNVSYAQPVTITWNSSNANYCNLIGGTTSLQNQSGTGSTVVYPTTSTSYYMTCYGSNGQTATSNIYINVSGNSGGNISVTASVSPSSIASGQSATLNWNSYNATYCTINNPSGAVILSSAYSSGNTTVYPTVSGNYVVNCYNGSQTGSANAYVTVGTTGTNPTVSVSPTSVNISSGQTTTAQFSVSNASYCYLNGGVYNNSYYSGNTLTNISVSPTTTTTYTATCYGSNNVSSSATFTVTVGGTSGGNVTLTAYPTSVTMASGSTVDLIFNLTNANYCVLNGGIYNNTYYAGNTLAKVSVNPITNTTYSATCYGANSSTQSSSQIVNISGTTVSAINISSVVGRTVNASVFSAVSNSSGIIDWGDGTFSSTSFSATSGGYTANISHTYTNAGTFTVKYMSAYGGTNITQDTLTIN